MPIETGALEQAYAKIESSFAVTPAAALAATDAFRHTELAITSKKNREASTEKRGTPDEAQSLPRRQTTQVSGASLWEPSGTIGTVSDVGKFIRAGMGSQHAITLVTTVASGPTATGATLTAVTGLQVGDVVVVTLSGGRREATRIKTLAGSVVTWDTLSAAPSVGAAVVSGVTFNLANNLADSIALYKYYNAGNFKQAAYGFVVDQLGISFDGTREAQLTYQGPAGVYADGSASGGTVQAKPASHTTVGSPASGLVGAFNIDAATALIISANIQIANNIELRNKELGTAFASGVAGRSAMRKVTVSVTAYLEDLTLLDKANSVVTVALRCVVGSTNGSMLAAVLPKVEFEIPDIGNEVGPKEITFEGTAYATNGNDQIFLAEA